MLDATLPEQPLGDTHSFVGTMKVRALASIYFALFIAGCGGSDPSSGTNGNTPGEPSPGGIWHGTDPVSGFDVLGLFDESGDFRLVRADRVQYVGTVSVSGETVSGDVTTLAERGTTFPDGSTHAAGHIDGRLFEKKSLRVDITDQTDNGTMDGVGVTMQYDSTYETKSSLAAVVGSYVEAGTGTVFTVDATGHFSALDATSGSSIDGAVSIIDPNYNIYDIAYTYSSCAGAAAALDDVTATGKGTFTDAGVGAQVLAAVSYTVAGHEVGVVVELNRT